MKAKLIINTEDGPLKKKNFKKLIVLNAQNVQRNF